MQGYGLTETCATGTIMDVHDAVGVEIVGPPLTGVHIKLRSWEEGKRVASNILQFCDIKRPNCNFSWCHCFRLVACGNSKFPEFHPLLSGPNYMNTAKYCGRLQSGWLNEGQIRIDFHNYPKCFRTMKFNTIFLLPVPLHIFILDSEITDLHKVAIVHKVDRKKAKKHGTYIKRSQWFEST